VVVHFRYVERLNRPVVLAAGSFLAISSVVMTYFGVNYLLSGLHSYASGESAGVPAWIYVTAVLMILLTLAGLRADRTRSWGRAR
jgi:purine-cytosine permease-like protein